MNSNNSIKIIFTISENNQYLHVHVDQNVSAYPVVNPYLEQVNQQYLIYAFAHKVY